MAFMTFVVLFALVGILALGDLFGLFDEDDE